VTPLITNGITARELLLIALKAKDEEIAYLRIQNTRLWRVLMAVVGAALSVIGIQVFGFGIDRLVG